MKAPWTLMRTLPGCKIASWISLCTVVRLGRPNAGEDGISAGCARDAVLPVPPVVGSSSAGAGDMDAEVDGLRLGCSFALFLQLRTLRGRLVEI